MCVCVQAQIQHKFHIIFCSKDKLKTDSICTTIWWNSFEVENFKLFFIHIIAFEQFKLALEVVVDFPLHIAFPFIIFSSPRHVLYPPYTQSLMKDDEKKTVSKSFVCAYMYTHTYQISAVFIIY